MKVRVKAKDRKGHVEEREVWGIDAAGVARVIQQTNGQKGLALLMKKVLSDRLRPYNLTPIDWEFVA